MAVEGTGDFKRTGREKGTGGRGTEGRKGGKGSGKRRGNVGGKEVVPDGKKPGVFWKKFLGF